jgi:hypothetical protein
MTGIVSLTISGVAYGGATADNLVLCSAQGCSRNGFNVADDYTLLATQTLQYSNVLTGPGQIAFLRDVVIPTCPGLALSGDPVDGFQFAVPYGPNPILAAYIADQRASLWHYTALFYTWWCVTALCGDWIAAFSSCKCSLPNNCVWCCWLPITDYCRTLCQALCCRLPRNVAQPPTERDVTIPPPPYNL